MNVRGNVDETKILILVLGLSLLAPFSVHCLTRVLQAPVQAAAHLTITPGQVVAVETPAAVDRRTRGARARATPVAETAGVEAAETNGPRLQQK